MFDEQWMKKTSKDYVYINLFQNIVFPKFELLNSGCGLSAAVYGSFSDLV